MKKGFTFFILLWLALGFKSLAQTPELETRYQNGRTLLDQQKFTLAMAEFLPLTNLNTPSPHQPEAMYLYAVAANKAGQVNQANAMLQQLIGNFPEWGNIEEAYYLVAKMAFEQQQFDKALLNLQIVKSEFIRADAEALEKFYLNTLSDKNRFKSLIAQFPNDAVLARVYADKLRNGWFVAEDRPMLENLVRKFNLDATIYDPAKLAPGRKKEEYKVAVLLPFQVFGDAAAQRKNQFAADLYAGMKMAQDSLAKNNIKINLLAYDADADTLSTFNVLQLPEMRGMDLVIGPVYKSSVPQAARFASKYKINFINPLSEDLEVVKDQPFMYLFESSFATRAKKAADFAYDHFENKTAAIIFENTRDDTVFARLYKKQFELRGGQVKLYKKIDTKKNPNVMAVYKDVDLTTFGHLMVASDRLPAAISTISQVETQNQKLPIITNESWLEMPQISLNQLDDLEIYFIHPKYLNSTHPAVRNFRQKYLNRYNVPPSRYAFAGYEMLFYFGNLLNNYGPQFQTFLPQMPTVSGVFYQGLNYNNAPDNQVVPILKLEDRQLVNQNPAVK